MWDRFLRACRRETVDRTPVWFMRQAGRYMAEYRAIREKYSLLEICRHPEVAVEVTLQPVLAHHVDAAILFADILLPIEPMGAPFDFAAGEGPRVHHPIRTSSDVEKLQLIAPEEHLGHVLEAIRILRRELDGKTPLIGFAGAPFTLASYLIEGGRSSHYLETKRMMYGNPEVFGSLMGKLAEVVRRYLRAQIDAGAHAVQLFDSWVGALSPADYQEFVFPHVAHILKDVMTCGVPVIHFGTGTATLLDHQKRAGGHVIGLDWRVPLDEGWARLGHDVAVQGNLDPTLLFAPWERLAASIDDILRRAASRPGHVFNLGHGILPETSPDVVRRVVEHVHRRSER